MKVANAILGLACGPALASLLAQAGQAERALELLGLVLHHPALGSDTKPIIKNATGNDVPLTSVLARCIMVSEILTLG